ncbi:MAG: SGNH/GDSL hydrolase family protein [Pseudomonadota bacterium]
MKSKLSTVAVYAGIAALTLIGAELAARIYDWQLSSRDGVTGDRLGQSRYYHSSSGYGDLVPSQDGHWVIWFHRPYRVQTNSVGLRNTEEPSDKAFRILALGDSQTFGPYLANDDTWPFWTEVALRRHYGDADKVQVFNAGISGYSIADELAYMKEKGVRFQPKLVLLAAFENDIMDLRREATPMRPKDSSFTSIQTAIKTLGRSSALVAVAQRVRDSIDRKNSGVDINRGERQVSAPETKPEAFDQFAARYEALFRELATLLKNQSIPFGVVFIPPSEAFSRGTSLAQPVVARAANANGVPFLDLTPELRGMPDPESRMYLLHWDQRVKRYTGNGHLSREGNAVIGKAVAKWLIENKLVP